MHCIDSRSRHNHACSPNLPRTSSHTPTWLPRIGGTRTIESSRFLDWDQRQLIWRRTAAASGPTGPTSRAIPGDDFGLYVFEGLLRADNFAALHLSSESFDEPGCLEMQESYDRVVSAHGCGLPGEIVRSMAHASLEAVLGRTGRFHQPLRTSTSCVASAGAAMSSSGRTTLSGLGCRRPAHDHHSSTSSARTRSDAGTAMPRRRATPRLSTSSYRVGCSKGMSAGFAPRRIRSTAAALRSYISRASRP